MRAAGIILAAGRGSRMKNFTANHPKCLVELAGKPLLHWQLSALQAADMERILVVRGYAAECLHGEFETVDNPRWAQTNMLASLLCADPYVRNAFSQGVERVVVSYSDIVYHYSHVQKLLSCTENIAITFDTQWESLWKLRFDDVLSDAETFRQENGLLREIGGKAHSVAEIQGQYMGLLAFNACGWQTLVTLCAELGDAMEKTDMTAFLRLLLSKDVPVGATPVAGKWCEADNETDLQQYETALANGTWSHDWR